jgi:hypothetical protein
LQELSNTKVKKLWGCGLLALAGAAATVLAEQILALAVGHWAMSALRRQSLRSRARVARKRHHPSYKRHHPS